MQSGEAGVFLSTGAIAMISLLLGSMATAVGIMFRALLASKDQQIEGWKGLFQSEQEINIGKDKILAVLASSGARALELARTSVV